MTFTRRRTACWLLLGVGGWLAPPGPARADEPKLPLPPAVPVVTPLAKRDQPAPPKDANGETQPAWKAWAPTGQPLTLGQCLQIGLERQPAIHAAKASLAQSEIGYLSLFQLRRLAVIVTPDLPVRKQQAQRGIAAGCAEVLKAQQENAYDVTRLYYTYIYATQQEQTAAEIVAQMEVFYKSAEEFLKLEVPDPKVKINEFTLGNLDAIVGEVRDLRDKASVGRKKALYALKEAMGVGPEFEFVPADKELPLMDGAVTQEEVAAHALGRRPELVQAAVVLDVTRLEVCAQAKQTRGQTVDTFARGTDLHARILPAPLRNGEYRPGAVPPEMPTLLVGRVEDRVARAAELVKRQEATYAKTVGLVQLESINAFLTWEEKVERVRDTKLRHERAQELAKKSRAAAQARMDPELVIRTEAQASQAQAKYVQAVYDQILALIALEKVTAGGVVPAFPGR